MPATPSMSTEMKTFTAATLPAGAGGGASSAGRAVRDEDGGTGEQPAAQRAPLTPDVLVVGRPLRLHQVVQHEAGGDQLANPVAEGTVLFDVGGDAVLVLLDVGAAVEVGVHGGQSALARVVEEDPAHRVGDGEHPA